MEGKALDKFYPNIQVVDSAFEVFSELVRSHVGEFPLEIIRIRDNRKVYLLTFKNIKPIRLDIVYSVELSRIQQIAYDNGIEIPKVIGMFQSNEIKYNKKFEVAYKYSEWIVGTMLMNTWNLAEVFYKSGDLMGRLNLINDLLTDKFLTNSEFSASNAVWTEDKKVYIIDHGKMKLTPNPDISIVQVLLKRIRNKERVKVFLEGYIKHRNADNIINEMEKRNWYWNKSFNEHLPPLI